MRATVANADWKAVGKFSLDAASNIAILSGLCLVAIGAFIIYEPAGLIVAGIEMVWLGWIVGR